MRWTTSLFALGGLILALAALTACGGGSTAPAVKPTPLNAQIRVVHASADAPPVDIYVEGVAGPAFTLSYLETSSYATLPEGSYNFQIYLEGADPTLVDPVFETGALPLGGNEVVTAVAAGSINQDPGSGEEFRVLAFVEGFGSAGSGALARIVHASPNAPTVAIDLGDDSTPDYSGLQRFSDTGPAGIPLPSGQALQAAILVDATLDRVTAFTTPSLPEGAELFVIATGFLGPKANQTDAFGLLVVAPDGTFGFLRQNPVIYGLHASPDTGVVDIALEGSSDLLVDDLEFSELSAPIQVPADQSYSIDVRDQMGNVALNFETPVLDAGESYLAAVIGYSGMGRSAPLEPRLLVDTLGGTPIEGNGLVRGLHLSPDAGVVDIGPVDGVSGNLLPLPGFEALNYRTTSFPVEGTEVPTSPLVIGVAPSASPTPLVSFDVDLEEDAESWVIVVGTADTASFPGDEGVRLVNVNTAVAPWTSAVALPKVEED